MKKSKVVNLFEDIGEMTISERTAIYASRGRNYDVRVNVSKDKLVTEKISSNTALAFAMKSADTAKSGTNKFLCNALKALVIINKSEDGKLVNVSVEDVISADFIDGEAV